MHISVPSIILSFTYLVWFYPVAYFYFRKRYNKDGQKVVFLAVSDDPIWIKVREGKKDNTYTGCPKTSRQK